MKYFSWVLLFISCFIFSKKLLAGNPTFTFVENKNQWDNQIRYRAEIPNGVLFLHKNSLQYTLYDGKALAQIHDLQQAQKSEKTERNIDFYNTSIQAHSFLVNFEGANDLPNLIAKKPVSWKNNYFLSNNPKRWAREVSSYEEITYQNLYAGIDLKFYTHTQKLKYEFIVNAHTDANQIKMVYSHADKLWLDADGNLVIQTSLGEIKEQKPYCYQLIKGKKVSVPARFVLENNIVKFIFPKGYDQNHALVIDPEIIFATYFGGADESWAYTSTYDAEENMYAAGLAFGQNLPLTLGAFDVNFSGFVDIIVSKLNATGTILLYSTFIGGIEYEAPIKLAINAQQELVIMLGTLSTDLPTQANSFDKTSNGQDDIYLIKLNATGSDFLGSTYLGGSEVELGYFEGDLAILETGEIYITGGTKSTNFPIKNPFQAQKKDSHDGFLVKLNNNLSAMIWGTYLGGDEYDVIQNIKIKNDKVYLIGHTYSNNLPTTPGVIQPNYITNGAFFITIFNEEGNVETLTYLAKSINGFTSFIEIDEEENVYAMGNVSYNYPVTPNTYSNPNGGVFIHKLNPTLTQTVFSTAVLPSANDGSFPIGFMIDACGRIIIMLEDESFNIPSPITPNAFQPEKENNTSTLYLMVLTKNAQELFYGTYFGKNLHAHGRSNFSPKGMIYQNICICGNNLVFPTQPADVIFPKKPSGVCNELFIKFDLGSIVNEDFQILDPITLQPLQNGCNITQALLRYEGVLPNSFVWEIDGVEVAKNQAEVLVNFPDSKIYHIKVKIDDPASCTQVIEKDFETGKGDFAINADIKTCQGDAVQLTASGGTKYTWTPTDGLDNPTIGNPVANPTQTTTYTVSIEGQAGCKADKLVKVEVFPAIKIDFEV